MPDLRHNIETALQAFTCSPLRDASLVLLKTLGYQSDKTIEIEGSKPQAFLDLIRDHNPDANFSEDKALFSDWLSADLLFQLTDDDISREATLFPETEIKSGLLRSYLFFAIELNGKSAVNGAYARGKLTAIARQLNRVFPMPVMVLLKHQTDKQPVLSIAVINRRQNKRDAHKDVLGKVTIIRDISLRAPHRGHKDILNEIAFSNLKHPDRLPITNFDTLHTAWEEIFNVELLNKRFYKELANWYFWAMPQVEFPNDVPLPDDKDGRKRRATSLIRLLTRLIFCWFIKEKSLISEKLFHRVDLRKILKDFDPDSETSSAYYHAILQNLFFATLNQQMGKPKEKGAIPYRRFISKKEFQGKSDNHGVTTLYRYPELFVDPERALDHFADIPFLNGGLFECLDREDPGNENRMLRIDGFTTKGSRSSVSNNLFFGEGEIELAEVTGEKRKGKVKALGLLRILNRYKFTIIENTPIDQEIALDPELLGKVFENLLASYNEETKITARKQTGSFYTPRPIVDYMVDESLKAHLAKALTDRAGMKPKDAKCGLDLLFTYTEKEHLFSEIEVETLLDAIHTCKILDPACGSGAFPMGMLHKLVYILSKLDPDNARWQARQIDAAERISDPFARDAAIKAIKKDFAENEDDYGRKLYLIESCLYGIDIQPIAIQITKLRFFISLVCDQKINRDKAKNHGIRPLPNLETKFVAADTLIGLAEMDASLLVDPRVGKIEKEIEGLYHRHFSIQRRDQKLAVQRKIKTLRQHLAKLLAESLMSPAKSQHIADWDPFDPQATAGFFDPHWMFGRSLAAGFHIVIGNPPYLFLSGKGSPVQKFAKEGKLEQADTLRDYFQKVANLLPNSSEGCRDYYKWFIERGLRLLNPKGVLAYITPNTFLTLKRYADIRHLLFGSPHSHSQVVDLGFDVFEVPIVPSAVTITQNTGRPDAKQTINFADLKHVKNILTSEESIRKGVASDNTEVAYRDSQLLLFKHPIAESLYLNSAKDGGHYFKAKEGEHGLDMSRVSREALPKTLLVTVIIDSELSRFHFCRTGSVPRDACPRFDASLHSGRRMYIRKTGDSIVCGFPPSEDLAVAHQNVYVVKANDPNLHWAVSAILNSSIATFLYRCGIHGQRGRIMAQFRVHALEAIPFPSELPPSHSKLFARVVPLFRFAISVEQAFLEDLIDACVMECYFREHMAERDLLFHDELAHHLAAYDPEASEADQRAFLVHLHRTLNAPDAKIRNRLLRITADSPDLLAIIKEEGRV